MPVLRITLITRSLTRGGAQTQIAALAKGLALRGHMVHVSTFYSGGANEAVIESAGIPIVALGKAGRASFMRPVRRLVAHLRDSHCDVAYSFLPLENLLGLLAAKLTGANIIWGLRGAAVGRGQYGIASRVLYGLQFRLLRQPDCLISNSVAALRELGLEQSSRIHAVPNGIDCERFERSDSLRVRFRAQHGFEASSRLVGIVARLDPMKDHETFLEAAAIVARAWASSHFIVAGEGPPDFKARLVAKAAALGLAPRVHWLGDVGDTPSVYSGLDIAVSSSAYGEGFSNSLGEAMACGLPVVATDVGDSARIVGEHGSVVPSRLPTLLAESIVRELDADTQALRLARRAWIAKEFGVEKMIERTESIVTALALGSK